MKCWICGKEESNADVKIDVDRLLWMVRNYFDTYQAYKMVCKKPSWRWTQSEKETYIKRDREEYCGRNAIDEVAAILSLDSSKLFNMARIARKWEQKRNWQYSFPTNEASKIILEYLKKDNDSLRFSSIEYVHYQINRRAEKTAKQKAA